MAECNVVPGGDVHGLNHMSNVAMLTPMRPTLMETVGQEIFSISLWVSLVWYPCCFDANILEVVVAAI